MLCPSCGTNQAQKHHIFGLLPCQECQDRQANLRKPGSIPEFAGESIQEQRKAHLDDITPAHRKGVPSREFRDRWGKEAMKRQGFSDKEIANAKYVWKGDLGHGYYKDGN